MNQDFSTQVRLFSKKSSLAEMRLEEYFKGKPDVSAVVHNECLQSSLTS